MKHGECVHVNGGGSVDGEARLQGLVEIMIVKMEYGDRKSVV